MSPLFIRYRIKRAFGWKISLVPVDWRGWVFIAVGVTAICALSLAGAALMQTHIALWAIYHIAVLLGGLAAIFALAWRWSEPRDLED